MQTIVLSIRKRAAGVVAFLYNLTTSICAAHVCFYQVYTSLFSLAYTHTDKIYKDPF